MAVSGQESLNAATSARIGYGIKRVEQRIMQAKTRALRRFGITLPQYATLMALHHIPQQSAAQLARIALVTPQTMATILTNLEHKQLITRSIAAVHARVLVCELSERGVGLIADADAAVREIEADLRSAYSAAEFAQFQAFLERAESRLASADARSAADPDAGASGARP